MRYRGFIIAEVCGKFWVKRGRESFCHATLAGATDRIDHWNKLSDWNKYGKRSVKARGKTAAPSSTQSEES